MKAVVQRVSRARVTVAGESFAPATAGPFADFPSLFTAWNDYLEGSA